MNNKYVDKEIDSFYDKDKCQLFSVRTSLGNT